MVGQLCGELDGRPLRIVATEEGVTLHLASALAAWKLRRLARFHAKRTLHFFRNLGLPLFLQVGLGNPIELLPKPGLLMRMLLPSSRDKPSLS
ncbi:MAG: hypothetical protein ACI9HK_003056 [Pirellulaceae bacterium]|jgi:hypothetical protein